MKEVFEKTHKDGVEVLMVSLDQTEKKLKSFIEENGLKYNHLFDGPGGKIAQRFGVRGIPQVYVVGRDGVLISDQARGKALDQAVEQALKTKAAAPEAAKDDEAETQAKKALAEADKLRDAKDYAAALEKYDQISLDFPGRPTAKLAAERAHELREDPALKKALAKSEAGGEPAKSTELSAEDAKRADRWMMLGKAAAKSGNADEARSYFQRVIDTFPGSAQAKSAGQELGKLKK